MGNAITQLGNWEMIEWFMSEADKMRVLGANNLLHPAQNRYAISGG